MKKINTPESVSGAAVSAKLSIHHHHHTLQIPASILSRERLIGDIM